MSIWVLFCFDTTITPQVCDCSFRVENRADFEWLWEEILNKYRYCVSRLPLSAVGDNDRSETENDSHNQEYPLGLEKK